MWFTEKHYDEMIERLKAGKTQLESNGNGCHVCGDSGHQAFECGFNPLNAIMVCKAVVERAEWLHNKVHSLEQSGAIGNADTSREGAVLDELHEFLHWLTGFYFHMGNQIGPAAIRGLKDQSE